jgi:hypothetical protein
VKTISVSSKRPSASSTRNRLFMVRSPISF